MLGPDKLHEISTFLLERCQQAQAEVWIEVFNEGLTRFANNVIHQNVSESNVSVSLRLTLDGRTGSATTNRLDGEALGALAQEALAAACLSPVDPAYPGLAQPRPVPAATAFDEPTAACTPEQRAAPVRRVCRRAAQAGLNAAGAYSTTATELAAANSAGIFAYHPYTCAEFQTTIMGADSSGRGQGVGCQIAQVPVEVLGEQAIQAALAGREPRTLPPGEYPVLLSPYAVMDMVQALNVHGAGGLSLLEGRSWMIGRQGQLAVSPLVSLWDDGADEQGVPLPFDGEGQPRTRVDLIRQGVVGQAVYDLATGKKAGKPSTGHALPPEERSQGPLACNLFFAPGSASHAELLRQAPKGALLITRFWYTRLVRGRDCTMTGMTRDGVFYVEGGELRYPVRNLRFTQSYVQALADVLAVGAPDVLQKGQYGELYARVPELLISKFRFTS